MIRRFMVASAFLGACFLGFATPVLASATSTPVHKKEVALTFDDGPYGAPTEKILTILEAEHVPATFFIIGKNVQKYPELVRREVADGDLIGNHSYNHAKNLALLTATMFRSNLDSAEQIIASTTGVHTSFFRPPYGSVSPTMRDVLRAEGYINVMWNVDPYDWEFNKSPAHSIVSRIMAHVTDDSIIVLHDGRDTHIGYPRGNTIDALPTIITDLKNKGYTFVTVDKLLH